MKTKSNTISPFIMLLVPALLAMLFALSQTKQSEPQQPKAFSFLSVPAFKGLVEGGFNCRFW
ncbi:MAG: hypothetical protein ACO1NU_05520 [Arcticibacter sp.]